MSKRADADDEIKDALPNPMMKRTTVVRKRRALNLDYLEERRVVGRERDRRRAS